MSDSYRWLQVIIPTHPPGMLHSKSAHPDLQVHQWFGVEAASLPTDREYTQELALPIPYRTSVLRAPAAQLNAQLGLCSMTRSSQKSTYSTLSTQKNEAGCQGLTPVAFHIFLQLSPFSFPSCVRKCALFACQLTVFARGVTKRVH
jgi:hypothetical protein